MKLHQACSDMNQLERDLERVALLLVMVEIQEANMFFTDTVGGVGMFFFGCKMFPSGSGVWTFGALMMLFQKVVGPSGGGA